jgi:hypothetical protein
MSQYSNYFIVKKIKESHFYDYICKYQFLIIVKVFIIIKERTFIVICI